MGLASATQGWLNSFILAHSMLIIKLFSNLLMYVTISGENKRRMWGFCLLPSVFRAAGLGQPMNPAMRHVGASAFVTPHFCNSTDLVPRNSNNFLHSWQLEDIRMQCDAAVPRGSSLAAFDIPVAPFSVFLKVFKNIRCFMQGCGCVVAYAVH